MNVSSPPRIYADFNGIYERGVVLLNCRGTVEDLARLGIQFVEGLSVVLYDGDADEFGNPDDLEVDATLHFRGDLICWVGCFDPNRFRHASDRAKQSPP